MQHVIGHGDANLDESPKYGGPLKRKRIIVQEGTGKILIGALVWTPELQETLLLMTETGSIYR